MNKKQYLQKFTEYVPSASQTLSKNPSQFVIGVSPVAVRRAKGAYFWDIEGKKYLDLMSALGAVVLGYGNARVNAAAKRAIDKGSIYSLPSELELQLAKLLRQVVPCAEMSRFAQNGHDVTGGAVRLARHITKRDHIAKCGYHGHQDWSICTKSGRNAGVPELLKTLTHDFIYNDPPSLEKIFKQYPNQIAAVILEPTSSEKPKDSFLEKVKEITHRHGALLIFDEMVTGFRFALGGAQEYFGVIPDLACFAKAIANGYPLSALCGKAEYMRRMDEIFVSMSLSGFTPALAAAIETITIMRERGDVQRHLHEVGDMLIAGANAIAAEYHAPFQFVGYGPHPVVTVQIADDYHNRVFKTYMYQEFHRAGIFFSTSLLMSYAHTAREIDIVLEKLRMVVKRMASTQFDCNALKQLLKGEVIAPRTVRTQQ